MEHCAGAARARRRYYAPFLPTFRWTAVEAAEFYQLQISTQPDFSGATGYTTAATEFTPSKALSNDKEYFWRIKAIDNQDTAGPYSAPRSFYSAWYFQPQFLTPPNNSAGLSYPFFSWSAVPGVERYRLLIDERQLLQDFRWSDKIIYNATSYSMPSLPSVDHPLQFNVNYQWKVCTIDAQGNEGLCSDAYSFQFGNPTSPAYIYPPYYYAPDAANLPVHTDLSIAYPLFVWDNAYVPARLPPHARTITYCKSRPTRSSPQ